MALSILPTAARQAHREYEERITDEIIEEHGEISPSALFEENKERMDDPKTDRTVRNYPWISTTSSRPRG